MGIGASWEEEEGGGIGCRVGEYERMDRETEEVAGAHEQEGGGVGFVRSNGICV